MYWFHFTAEFFKSGKFVRVFRISLINVVFELFGGLPEHVFKYFV